MENFDLFFRLLRLGLGTEHVDTCDCLLLGYGSEVEEQWRDIYKSGVRQGVGVILFDGLQKLVAAGAVKEECLPSRVVKSRWMGDSVRLENLCGGQYRLASELAGIYASNGIRTVVLKGIAAGICYPVPEHRPCGDLDCFLLGHYEEGNVIAENLGADVVRDHYKHSHIKYKGLEVENHQFCTAVRGNKQLKSFERLLQSLLKEEGTTRIGDTCLECPSPMFNVLFLTHHAQRHYLSEGIALRHLCDWAMFLKVHGDEVDWERFRSYAVEYGLKDFSDSMTRLSVRYLGIAAPACYDMLEDDMRDEYLLRDILRYHNEHGGENKWKARFGIIKSVWENRKRYRYFSDRAMLSGLFVLVLGFLFDRNPKL